MLTDAQKANVIEGEAAAEASPAKRLGRPPGGKNKAKGAAPAPAPTRNAVDVDNSAAAMRAKMAELEDSAATKAPDDSLDLRGTFMDRRNEQQGDAGAAA